MQFSFNQNEESQRYSNWIVRDYQLGRKLGEGSYGCVFKAKHQSTKRKVAVKLIATHNLDHRHSVLNEVSILRHLQSDEECYIVHLVDSFEILPEDCPFEMSALPNTDGSVDTIVCIVTEYIKGDLLCHVQEKGRLRESEAAQYFRQLLVAVQWCHEKGVVHRDIKLDNMLLASKYHLKLIDFGLSEYMDQPAASNFVGSFAYTAPEVFKKKPYNKAVADIWSCGVVLYTMVTGEFPWEGATPQEQVKNIVKGRWIVPIASPECCDLLKSIMQPDPATRFTVDDILSHPWMQKHCKELAVALNSSGEREVATGKQELESPRPRRASLGLGRLQIKMKPEPVVTVSSAAT